VTRLAPRQGHETLRDVGGAMDLLFLDGWKPMYPEWSWPLAFVAAIAVLGAGHMAL
jgi:predicted O-methyltransferase YrrM